jgi:hypothetical protein
VHQWKARSHRRQGLGSYLAGTKEAGDDGGGDAIVRWDHRLYSRTLLLCRGSRRRRKSPARSPRRRRSSSSPRCCGGGVGARGGAQAQAEEGGDPARGKPERRRRGDGRGGGAERRHGVRGCEREREGNWASGYRGTDLLVWRKRRFFSAWSSVLLKLSRRWARAPHARVASVGPGCVTVQILPLFIFICGPELPAMPPSGLSCLESYFSALILGYTSGPPTLSCTPSLSNFHM